MWLYMIIIWLLQGWNITIKAGCFPNSKTTPGIKWLAKNEVDNVLDYGSFTDIQGLNLSTDSSQPRTLTIMVNKKNGRFYNEEISFIKWITGELHRPHARFYRCEEISMHITLALPVPTLSKHYVTLRHMFLHDSIDNARNCVKMHRVVCSNLLYSQQVLYYLLPVEYHGWLFLQLSKS